VLTKKKIGRGPQAASESDRVWSWYTGAGLTVVERIDRVDHKLEQTVAEFCVALPRRVRRRTPVGLFAAMSGAPGATADAAAAAPTATATGTTAAAATPAAASGLPGRRYAAASARARHATHARLAAVGRVRMLLEHTHTHTMPLWPSQFGSSDDLSLSLSLSLSLALALSLFHSLFLFFSRRRSRCLVSDTKRGGRSTLRDSPGSPGGENVECSRA